MSTVGLAITSIPPRGRLLTRALKSVSRQERTPDRLVVSIDYGREGAAANRNHAWRGLGDVDYIAFLDDDDELKPEHLRRLEETIEAEQADFVYPWFQVIGGSDPFPMHFGKPWDPSDPIQTTITGLWRREALEMLGGFAEPDIGGTDSLGHRAGEDYLIVCALSANGGKIVHLPERTWCWHHDSSNTSGLPSRW